MKIRTDYTYPLEIVHDLIRGKWKTIIMYQLQYGDTSLSKLKREISGVSEKMLLQHLGELKDFGLVDKMYTEGYPLNVSYYLTPRGLKVLSAVNIMQDIGIEYMVEAGQTDWLDKRGIRYDKQISIESDATAKIIDSENVKEYTLNEGASVVGIAASEDFTLAPEGFKPTDTLKACKSVVVLGVPFPQDALSKSSSEYTKIRSEILKKTNEIANNVAHYIRKFGYNAKTIHGAHVKYVNGKPFGEISLKHAAWLAGLGVINKNNLLTNPEYGNLLWLSAVLTDADLTPDKSVNYKICNECNECVNKCPSKALNDINSFGEKECMGTSWALINGNRELVCCQCRSVCSYKFGSDKQTNITSP